MDKQHPDSGRGSGKRGRPAVGKPEQVRLSDSEKALAIALGDGVLAKGVRQALLIAQGALSSEEMNLLHEIRLAVLGDPGGDMDHLRSKVLDLQARAKRSRTSDISLNEIDMAAATELGEGDAAQGVSVALSAARFLGIETSRKMSSHGSDRPPK